MSTKPTTNRRCSNCGYDLHALRDPRCPECGREFDPDVRPVVSRFPLKTDAAPVALSLGVLSVGLALPACGPSGVSPDWFLLIPAVTTGVTVGLAVSAIRRGAATDVVLGLLALGCCLPTFAVFLDILERIVRLST